MADAEQGTHQDVGERSQQHNVLITALAGVSAILQRSNMGHA